MAEIQFIKMHGCGNDYVFLDCFNAVLPVDPSKLAIQISDRRRSIGSDGLVLMLPSHLPNVDARMQMFNADGSEGSLCVNAIRCMVMWLHQSGRCGSRIRVVMSDRIMEANVVSSNSDRRTATVRITIGRPVEVNAEAVGRNAFVQSIELDSIPLPPLLCSPVYVSMGNPHTILFVKSLNDVDITTQGPLIETLVDFPQRTNVEFVQVTGPSSAQVRVWERGSGETLACGSGACAVAVAGTCRGYFEADAATHITMPGGILTVTWDERDHVHLQGPAEEAFRGILYA